MRRTRRWYECLRVLRSDEGPTKAEAKQGKGIHAQLEALWPEFNGEAPSVYHDESLPFDIVYHPDLYDPAGTVVEIKPWFWFWSNVPYCVAQISGYMHFKQAKGVFRLYKADSKGSVSSTIDVQPPYILPWERLREVALKSDELQGRA